MAAAVPEFVGAVAVPRGCASAAYLGMGSADHALGGPGLRVMYAKALPLGRWRPVRHLPHLPR